MLILFYMDEVNFAVPGSSQSMTGINAGGDVKWYHNFQTFIQKSAPFLIEQLSSFWYQCFPWLVTLQLNKFSAGFINIVLAYERDHLTIALLGQS